MTPATIEAVAAQLRDELGGRAAEWVPIAGDEGLRFWRTVAGRCDALAAVLCSDDDLEAAQAVIDIGAVLWPGTCEPPHDWWRTPVGRVCARSLGRTDTDAVTHSVAAAMLGVTRGTVAQLVHRGTLDRHPDGGVTRASVLARIARRA